MLTVNEIFHSIQGESTYAGEPCVFVRLTACDLRCSWCDTPYAFHEGRKMSIDDVRGGRRSVRMWDGGDHGRRTAAAAGRLSADGTKLLEGQACPARDGRASQHRRRSTGVIRIMSTSNARDPASPGRTDWANLGRLTARSGEVRHQGSQDYEFAREIVAREHLPSRAGAVLFSPVHGVMNPRDLAEWILADRLAVRLQLQAHKYIWSPDARGV
jgi:7-carboxy-7-deazaguanine synthase